jgi:hypothetical protein
MADEKSTPDGLDMCHIALRTMLRDGQIQQETYFKGIVDLAFHWIELGERECALSLVHELSDDYVNHTLRCQIQEDPEFAAQALAVATYLDNGLPNVDDEDVKIALMLLNRPEAKA